jgi:hypothetical protein
MHFSEHLSWSPTRCLVTPNQYCFTAYCSLRRWISYIALPNLPTPSSILPTSAVAKLSRSVDKSGLLA